ncbi:MAG: nuclear transport factor 2 family protein, partial [Beijerinckiaceae bacterium]
MPTYDLTEMPPLFGALTKPSIRPTSPRWQNCSIANASWHTPGRSSIAGDRKGRDAVFTQFDRYGGETIGTFRANLLNVLESEDGRVVAVHQNSAERNGRRLDVLCCIVFELENGRILIGREHFYDLYV